MVKAKTVKFVLGAIGVFAIAGATYSYLYPDRVIPVIGRFVNYGRASDLPAGTFSVEAGPDAAQPIAHRAVPVVKEAGWLSFNRTLTSERFTPLDQINRENASRMKVECTYDTGEFTSFQAGPLVIDGVMIATTEKDIFSIDPGTCKEIWRTHEEYTPANIVKVNRGAAFLDGRLFRGTQDGRVLAYDFKTGKRLWETTIADPLIGESAPSAPIAWQGMVFIGTAGGDVKGVKGRMYALDAATGKIRWEFYLVPQGPKDKVRGPHGKTPLDTATWQNKPDIPITGGGTWTTYSLDPEKGLIYIPGGNPAPDFANGPRKGDNLYSGSVVVLDAKTGDYVRHYQLVPEDWHDWDVSGAPTLAKSWAGRSFMAVAPKDGKLYSFDRDSGEKIFEREVTRRKNADARFEVGKKVHFCPGTSGGAEWNGPAYNPSNNLIYIGEVDWCAAVQMADDDTLINTPMGAAWLGHVSVNPYEFAGKFDPKEQWGGWLYAVGADSGEWRWRVRVNYPVLGGTTPTAGNVVFFGDMGGNFYALDADSGKKLWGQKIGGAIGGGVITYTTRGTQKVAVAAGFTSPFWPTEQTTGKIVILGLDN